MFFRILRSRSGFTLTEIMTVVIVLGILSAISVPIFVSSYEKEAIKDCKNQRVLIETMVKEAMYGMIDNGKAQYKYEEQNGELVQTNKVLINFSNAGHTTTYKIGDEDKPCFMISKEAAFAFTLGDLRGGYRESHQMEYQDGFSSGHYLKKRRLENTPFYVYFANQDAKDLGLPVCPFTDTEKGREYNYYIFEDGSVICSCPKCH